jgi:hypothetical protein
MVKAGWLEVDLDHGRHQIFSPVDAATIPIQKQKAVFIDCTGRSLLMKEVISLPENVIAMYLG